MGWDYALVHIKYTISAAVLLSLLYRPLFNKRDVYRIIFLVTIAVTATIPWDSYLIRTRIWSYPSHAVLGPTFFDIPVEELFFFVIQTYDVSLLYLILTKSTFYPAYLYNLNPSRSNHGFYSVASDFLGFTGQILFFVASVAGAYLTQRGGSWTYMGLILVWAFPFLLLLWTLSCRFMLRIPAVNLVLPIVIPTLYLWVVDTFSLKRGTWVIETGTKCGLHIWDGLELEEAFFFLVTNMLIVFGQLAFENAVAVIDSLPEQFPEPSPCPSPITAVRALLMSPKFFENDRLLSLSEALVRLQKKSRSFFLASSAFDGRLRIDLILLYSFCRMADDLIDTAQSQDEAQTWVNKLRHFLDMSYRNKYENIAKSPVQNYVLEKFPSQCRLALLQLPVSCLSSEPLYELLDGFNMDLKFSAKSPYAADFTWPIDTARDLEQYGKYVAGTVAELCLDLIFHYHRVPSSSGAKDMLKGSAIKMGIALQTVNIARDIKTDASLKRVYIPTEWLKEEDLSPMDVISNPSSDRISRLRTRLLDKAFESYNEARPALEELPPEARAPMRVAIESYMEIGRVLRNSKYTVKAGRATVPIGRRIWVAWKTLNK